MSQFTKTMVFSTDGDSWRMGPSVDWNDDGSVQVHGARLRTMYCTLFPTASGVWKPRAVLVTMDPLELHDVN